MRRVLLLAGLLLTTRAFADTPTVVTPPPDVPPPAPDAPPKKVEQARDVAKTAELHPIIPNPNEATKPAFLLYAEIDPPILATGLVFMLGRTNHMSPAYCAPLCDSGSLNALDGLTAGYYSTGWSRASDIGLYSLAVGAAGVLFLDEGVLDTLNDGVVIGEATISSTALASVMTLAAGRPRPFLYSDKAPLSVRNSGDAGLSFISSHTAMSFALVTSLFIAEHRLHPNSSKPYWLLGVGLGIASGVAVARVMSGYHFITDAAGGAVVGSSIGVLVSSVHRSPVHVVPVTNTDAAGNVNGAGVGVRGEF